jgi:hypothetical protein
MRHCFIGDALPRGLAASMHEIEEQVSALLMLYDMNILTTTFAEGNCMHRSKGTVSCAM